MTQNTKPEPSYPRVCAVVRQMRRQHPTEELADIKEAVKLQLVKLGFRYDNDQINRAMAYVEQRLPYPPRPVSSPTRTEPSDSDASWPRSERSPGGWSSLREIVRGFGAAPAEGKASDR
jgi:hypothetical protein